MEANLKYDPDQILFRDLFEKYLKRGGSCFEIGCYPGNFLIYFAKVLGYNVSGLDMTPHLLEKTPAYLQKNGVTINELIHQDFMEYKPSKVYDLVCSFGFVEHFLNYEEIITKHIQMVKTGGTLIITCPSLNGLQYYLHLLIDRKCLPSHVISAMSLRKWRRILEKNHMRLLYHNYYKTAGFVRGPDEPDTRFQRWAQRKVDIIFSEIDKRISYPNFLLSPWLVSISQRI